MRSVCQGDIFRYINEELRVTQKAMCSIFNKVREGNMTETRISEIKQGKRKGYRGLKSAASLCFTECFQQQDSAYTLRNLRQFLTREELSFPGSENEEEDLESYALRFLEYGLDNCMCPGEFTEENAVGEASMDASVDRVVEPSTNIPMDSSGNPVMETTLLKAEQAIPLLPEPRGADFTAENPLGKKILENRNCFFFTVGVIALVFFIMHLGKMNTLDIFLQCIRLSPFAFFALSFMLAVSPFFLGLVDTAIAVFFYCQRNPAVEVKLNSLHCKIRR